MARWPFGAAGINASSLTAPALATVASVIRTIRTQSQPPAGVDRGQRRSKRSRSITLTHTATKSCTNFCSPSPLA